MVKLSQLVENSEVASDMKVLMDTAKAVELENPTTETVYALKLLSMSPLMGPFAAAVSKFGKRLNAFQVKNLFSDVTNTFSPDFIGEYVSTLEKTEPRNWISGEIDSLKQNDVSKN
jgi:hypothetical protein